MTIAVPRAVGGFKFEEFMVVSPREQGRGHNDWYMTASAHGYKIEQRALHMSPATVYNFSIRAAEELVRLSMEAAITDRGRLNG